MAVYYVGPGGNNANNGLSWAQRKLTLNGAEDIPLAAGDTVHVGPGTYREVLTLDVSGTAGNPITYVADTTGQLTDGVGGVVRVTGSDNDTTEARTNCISASGRSYRTWRGFAFDMASEYTVNATNNPANWTFEDCAVFGGGGDSLIFSGTISNVTIRRCFFSGSGGVYAVNLTHSATVNDTGCLLENCIFCVGRGIAVARIGGVAVRNCTFYGVGYGVRLTASLAAGQTTVVNNCIFQFCTSALQATATGFLVENYNTFYRNATDRTTVEVGANSVTYPPHFTPPLLVSGQVMPWSLFQLAPQSPVARLAGTGMAAEDTYGLTRPATDAKKSWGALQYTGAVRDTTIRDGSSGASLKLPDAGQLLWKRAAVANVSTTFTARVYREAGYTGDAPRLIVRQAGQADQVATDSGPAGQWNTLTLTFTPAASPAVVQVLIESRNTAAAGSYATYFDTFGVA